MPRDGRLMSNIPGFVWEILILAMATVIERVHNGPVPIPEFSHLQVVEGAIARVQVGDYDDGQYGYLLTLRDQRVSVWYEYPRAQASRVSQELVRGTPIRAWIDPAPIREWLAMRSPSVRGKWAFQLEADGQLLLGYAESAQRRERLNHKIPSLMLVLFWIIALFHAVRATITRLVPWLYS